MKANTPKWMVAITFLNAISSSPPGLFLALESNSDCSEFLRRIKSAESDGPSVPLTYIREFKISAARKRIRAAECAALTTSFFTPSNK